MTMNLRFDPRKVKKFSEIGLPTSLVEKLETTFPHPLPIQKKILALNSSGCSVLAHSVPRQGKSTAAVLSLLSIQPSAKKNLSNLILVPSPALADQYYENLCSWRTEIVPNYLYRTGSEEQDNQQHQNLLKNLESTTLIGTPQRILDYIHTAPSLIALDNLKQLVIDELDVFAPEQLSHGDNKISKVTPLERLVEHVLKTSSPIITALLTSTNTLANFSRLRDLLEKSHSPMYEVAEPQPEKWSGETSIIKLSAPVNSPEDCSKAIKKHWDGTGLVVIPDNLSPMKTQELLSGMGAVVANPVDICGLNVENLNRLYLLGIQKPEVVDKLKWFMSGAAPKMYIIANTD